MSVFNLAQGFNSAPLTHGKARLSNMGSHALAQNMNCGPGAMAPGGRVQAFAGESRLSLTIVSFVVIEAFFETIAHVSGLETANALASTCRVTRDQMQRVRARLDEALAPKLVFINVAETGHRSHVTAYNWATKSMTRHAHLPTWRLSFAVAVKGDAFYVCGGLADDRESNAVEQYSLKLGVWTELPGMPTPRAELAAAILGNDLYVMGGCSAEGRGYEFFGMSTPRVEALNLPSCSWTRLPSMLIGRNGCASAVLGGVVYILGGVDHHDVILNTVERFNPCDAGWKHGPPMHTFRSCCCAAVIHNRIYVAGGHDEWDREVTGLEMFDPIADAWFSQPAMSTPRRIFQLVVAQPFVNNVFAFGGANFYCLNEDDIKLNSVAMHDSICEMDELVFNQVGNTWAMDDSIWYVCLLV
jgi:hypothetical protein